MQDSTRKEPTNTHIGCHNPGRPRVTTFTGTDGTRDVALYVTPEITV